MDYQVTEKKNATIVQINGELDVANAMELSDYLTGLFKKFPKRVILNLEAVNYIASSGLAMLVAALKKSRETRVPFAICGLSPMARKAVEMTTLHEILPIYENVDESLNKLQETPAE
ncbi:MAG: STAS domain-containing protein [Candidatus Omnitrophica bacterium]|nr:STAS domain-containing protein [Candidatus Omnitrophota bacterium]MCB9767905.1 STAS domain-containing protein [Candidatus Omnitrophota bacterium]MCB9781854.1 STAS domain-containing protein [Candidatus Omnitrophota bacterium]